MTALGADGVGTGSSQCDCRLVDVFELGLVLVPVLLASSLVSVSDDVVRRHLAPNTVEVLILGDHPKKSQTMMLTCACSGQGVHRS